MTYRGAILLLWSALLGPTQVLAQGCAMCGSSMGTDDHVARAFSWSILFLLTAPYVLVGVVGSWLYFTYRRASGRRRAPLVHLPWTRPTDRPKEA